MNKLSKARPRNRGQQYHIPMLKRSLDLLQLLAASPDGGMSLSELARQLHAPKSSIFKIIRTLEAEGFVSWESRSEKYNLTRKLLTLADTVASQSNLRDDLLPFLKELRDRSNETVNLGILDGETAIYIESLEGPGPVKCIVQPGKQLALHSTALGKCLLAFRPESEIDRILTAAPLEAYTPHTCTDPVALKKEMAQVRRQGYALDVEEDNPEACCIGAPIRDHLGRVIAAISLTAPSYRLPRSALKSIALIVVESASRMSHWLGYVDPSSLHQTAIA